MNRTKMKRIIKTILTGLAKNAAGVTESGAPVNKAKGVTFLRMENNAAVYAVGSGNYQFKSQLLESTEL